MHGLQSQLSYTPLWLLARAQTFALFTDTYNLHTQTNEKVQNVFTHFIFMLMKMRHRHAHPGRQCIQQQQAQRQEGPAPSQRPLTQILVACVRRVRAQTATGAMVKTRHM